MQMTSVPDLPTPGARAALPLAHRPFGMRTSRIGDPRGTERSFVEAGS
jgi:hypothetical protein